MLNIKNLENSGFFKTFIINKGEILFDEGDIDNNLYIVKLGELKVEKKTDIKKGETKLLGFIKSNEVFGEAAINNDKVKEVRIIASKKTYLISINAKNGLDKFSKKYPKDSMDLLKYIIHIGNKRLLESNNQITTSYRINKEIINIKNINNKGLFSFIDKMVDILNIDHILYYETNPVLNDYIKLKYDSRNKGKMVDKIIEKTENKLDILDMKINNYFNFEQKLTIGDNVLGYLIFVKKWTQFADIEKKVLISASIGFSGLIKQKILIEEERNKEYMEGY